MRLLNSEQTLWNKEINITVTLRELQELYCALGITSYSDINKEWKQISDYQICPFDDDDSSCLYDDIEKILKEQGGKTNG